VFSQETLTSVTEIVPYTLTAQVPRQAGWNATVCFDRSRYSIPPEHAGKPVLVEADDQRIVIRTGDLVIAEHQRAARPDSSIILPEISPPSGNCP